MTPELQKQGAPMKKYFVSIVGTTAAEASDAFMSHLWNAVPNKHPLEVLPHQVCGVVTADKPPLKAGVHKAQYQDKQGRRCVTFAVVQCYQIYKPAVRGGREVATHRLATLP